MIKTPLFLYAYVNILKTSPHLIPPFTLGYQPMVSKLPLLQNRHISSWSKISRYNVSQIKPLISGLAVQTF
jgi:hypothetical protein